MLMELITRFENEARENQKIINSGEGCTSYARFFDDYSEVWNNDMYDRECILVFLRVKERYANDILKARKYMFLNDVYELLGLPRTAIGQVVGWIYDEKEVISFGVYTELNVDFLNGYRRTPLLDFNVDGVILDKI